METRLASRKASNMGFTEVMREPTSRKRFSRLSRWLIALLIVFAGFVLKGIRIHGYSLNEKLSEQSY